MYHEHDLAGRVVVLVRALLLMQVRPAAAGLHRHTAGECVFVCIHMGVVEAVSGWGGLPGQVGGCVLYGTGSSFEHLVPVL